MVKGPGEFQAAIAWESCPAALMSRMSEFSTVTYAALAAIARFCPTVGSPAMRTLSSSMWCGTCASEVCDAWPRAMMSPEPFLFASNATLTMR